MPDGTQILNTAILSSKDENGIDYTSVASAPAAVAVRGVPDVTIDKSHTGTFVRGQQGTFSLLVSNVGGRATSGAVVIDDTLPTGLGVVSAAGTGWACSVDTTANSLHCDRSDSLAVGAAYPPVSVVVNVLESAPDTIINTGITGGGSETNTSNNTDSDTVAVTSSRRRRDRQVGDADHDAARQERHLHDGRDEQRPLDRPGRQGGRPAAGRHDVRVRDAGRVRARRHDRALLAGRRWPRARA